MGCLPGKGCKSCVLCVPCKTPRDVYSAAFDELEVHSGALKTFEEKMCAQSRALDEQAGKLAQMDLRVSRLETWVRENDYLEEMSALGLGKYGVCKTGGMGDLAVRAGWQIDLPQFERSAIAESETRPLSENDWDPGDISPRPSH